MKMIASFVVLASSLVASGAAASETAAEKKTESPQKSEAESKQENRRLKNAVKDANEALAKLGDALGRIANDGTEESKRGGAQIEDDMKKIREDLNKLSTKLEQSSKDQASSISESMKEAGRSFRKGVGLSIKKLGGVLDQLGDEIKPEADATATPPPGSKI